MVVVAIVIILIVRLLIVIIIIVAIAIKTIIGIIRVTCIIVPRIDITEIIFGASSSAKSEAI